MTRHKGAQVQWHDYVHTATAGDAAEDDFISYMSGDLIRDYSYSDLITKRCLRGGNLNYTKAKTTTVFSIRFTLKGKTVELKTLF